MTSETAGELPVIHLKTERRSLHPWIFQKMVEKPTVRPKPGSVVEIIDREGAFAGRGFSTMPLTVKRVQRERSFEPGDLQQ